MGGHPCRGRSEWEETANHRTHYNNQSHLPPWVGIPAEGEATERNSQSQDTLLWPIRVTTMVRIPAERRNSQSRAHYNNQSQLPPWVRTAHPWRGRGNIGEQPITGHITITNHSYHHGCVLRIPSEGEATGEQPITRQLTIHNNQSQLAPWVGMPAEREVTANHRIHLQ